MKSKWTALSVFVLLVVLSSPWIACTDSNSEPIVPKTDSLPNQDSIHVDGNKTCRELGMELRNANPNTANKPVYKVISPNGGDFFKVGDTLKGKAISSQDSSDAQLVLVVLNEGTGKSSRFRIGPSGSLNFHSECEFSVVIPDYAPIQNAWMSFVSSKVYIQVESKLDSSEILDRSDSSFEIRAGLSPLIKSCQEYGMELRETNLANALDPIYQILKPNGGESYKVGDTLQVIAIAGNNEPDAILDFRIEDETGKTASVLWPTQTRSFRLQDSCIYTMVLPESLSVGGRRYSLVSSRVKMRVSNYNTPSQIFDMSDDYFRISPHIE
jgi:hypothetical protein